MDIERQPVTLQSSIAWLDFSESDRRRMNEVISLFKERDTRDELGLGSIRDALADLSRRYGADAFWRIALLDQASRLPERRFHLREVAEP